MENICDMCRVRRFLLAKNIVALQYCEYSSKVRGINAIVYSEDKVRVPVGQRIEASVIYA